MFAYLGLESATVPAGDVRDPKRTISRSTIFGISIAASLYVLGTVVVMGVVPREQLVTSLAPFQDAARLMWGRWAAYAISIGVILSSIGALNGWTLMMGQVPMAAARVRRDSGLIRVDAADLRHPSVRMAAAAQGAHAEPEQCSIGEMNLAPRLQSDRNRSSMSASLCCQWHVSPGEFSIGNFASITAG